MAHYTPSDGRSVQEHGVAMVKRRNPIYVLPQSEAFTVETNEGVMRGHAGYFLAYDPMSGHIWPISSEYISIHYEDF